MTILSSIVGNNNREAITVTMDLAGEITCDVRNQVVVTVNGVEHIPTSVLFTTQTTMVITLSVDLYITDVVTWIYHAGVCVIQSLYTNTPLETEITNTVTNNITDSLIIYPALNYDSFATMYELDVIMAKIVGNKAFATLSQDDKELFYRQAAVMIEQCPNITLPVASEDDLVYAQAVIAGTYSTVDINTVGGRETSEEKVGSLLVKYFQGGAVDISTFPQMAKGYLKQYGCTQSSGTFSQSSVTRG